MSYFKNSTLTTNIYGTPTICDYQDLAENKTDYVSTFARVTTGEVE